MREGIAAGYDIKVGEPYHLCHVAVRRPPNDVCDEDGISPWPIIDIIDALSGAQLAADVMTPGDMRAYPANLGEEVLHLEEQAEKWFGTDEDPLPPEERATTYDLVSDLFDTPEGTELAGLFVLRELEGHFYSPHWPAASKYEFEAWVGHVSDLEQDLDGLKERINDAA